MDEGGIYEEGTPDEIFDDPKREKTRRFIRRLKVLEINVSGRDFDYPGIVSELDYYCVKNQISGRSSRRLLLTLEEMLQQLLIPKLSDPEIKVDVEYAEGEEIPMISFRYNGPENDVVKEGDPLSVDILKSAVSRTEFSFNPAEPLGNRVVMHIKND